MRHVAKLMVVLVGSVAGTAVVSFAAGLGGLASDPLAGDSVAVAACDADGFTPSYIVTAGLVTHVRVEDIADPGCEGGELSVVLADSSGSSVGTGGPVTVTADGDTAANSVTVPLNPDPAKDSVVSAHVAVTGP